MTISTLNEESEKQKWFDERKWALSANRLLQTTPEENDSGSTNRAPTAAATAQARSIYFPKTEEEVAAVLRSHDGSTVPVATVAGGHESSNVALVSSKDAVILDMKHFDKIAVHQDTMQVTVGAGVKIRALAEAVHDAKGALPVGTGGDVGVFGYVLNGGLSGYFGRRLGLLGQRVVKLTIITADGSIKHLSRNNNSSDGDQDLFFSILGAGSSMGVVTSMTFQMAEESTILGGGQIIVPCGNLSLAQQYTKSAFSFMKECILDTGEMGLSMELVVTSDMTAIATFTFYDSFTIDDVDEKSKRNAFVQPLRDAATALNLPIILDNLCQWSTWFEVASSLWPVIDGMKGELLVTLQHAFGTKESPSAEVLKYLNDIWLGELPLAEAPMSIVEARTLGGAIKHMEALPTGNYHQEFFVDAIIVYDAHNVSRVDRKNISERVAKVLSKGKDVESLIVDFSGTHCQADDDDANPYIIQGKDIFGDDNSYRRIQCVKRKVDPKNRFRFHPFRSLLS